MTSTGVRSRCCPGTTHFVTQVPDDTFTGTFSDYLKTGRHGIPATIEWLDWTGAAWLFKDGVYAVATGPNQMEIRTLVGKTIHRYTIDPVSRYMSSEPLEHYSTSYAVRDDIWKEIQDRETARHASRPARIMNPCACALNIHYSDGAMRRKNVPNE